MTQSEKILQLIERIEDLEDTINAAMEAEANAFQTGNHGLGIKIVADGWDEYREQWPKSITAEEDFYTKPD